MKDLLAAIAAVAISALAWAPWLAPVPADGQIVIDPYRFGGGGGSPTYLVEESFDTNPGFDETWTNDTTGIANPDYTTTVLQGTESALMTIPSGGGSFDGAYVAFTGGTDRYFYFLFRFDATVTNDKFFAQVRNSSNAPLGTFLINSSSQMEFAGAVPSLALSINTNYHVWGRLFNDTGSNGVRELCIAAVGGGGTRPTTGSGYATFSSSSISTDMARFFLFEQDNKSDSFDVIIDGLIVADDWVGNDPWGVEP